ncbi:heterodisulfide reductase-related iron-sulfur binding cluster [Bradyrhizobium sp. Pha-3]|uniref:heterodisulfide reductase-related iron-sulfur binding cluster n=1 Tax=Bradyrhizobium sp. Pha-3 TaxID=208375 RepID=UPI0035D4A5F3
MKEAIGLSEADPKHVLGGIVDLIRGGEGNEAAQRWAGACSSSGYCREACDYGVDPLFLVKMANYKNVRRRDGDAVRKNAAASFRRVAKSLRIISRLQLDRSEVARLQPEFKPATNGDEPDIAFYIGCNVGKTPHIVLLCVEILQAMGFSCEIIGGSSACCGINQFRAGDGETAGRAGMAALSQIEAKQATTNLTWCPSCQSQFEHIILPAHQLMTGRDDLDMTPFYVFLERHLDRLKPLMKHDMSKRVAINERPGRPDVVHSVERLLSEISGVELVHLDVPRAGLMSTYLTVTPKFKESLRVTEFEAAARAGVTTLATIFHGCQRELCKFENGVSFEIVNAVEIIGESIGIRVEDTYKKLALAASVEDALESCAPLLAEHGLNADEARSALLADMLGSRPLQGAVQEVV